jgi:hypothetical protein
MTQSNIVAKDAGNTNTALETIYDSTANTHQPVHYCGGTTVFITDSRTRANSNTTYAANTLIGNTTNTTLSFSNTARKVSGTGQILSAKITKGGNAGAATIPSNLNLRLWLFNSDPTPGVTDGNTYLPTWANRTKRLGYVDFVTWTVGSDCAESVASPIVTPLGFSADASNKLYGVIQTVNSFVPSNSEIYEVSLTIIQD